MVTSVLVLQTRGTALEQPESRAVKKESLRGGKKGLGRRLGQGQEELSQRTPLHKPWPGHPLSRPLRQPPSDTAGRAVGPRLFLVPVTMAPLPLSPSLPRQKLTVRSRPAALLVGSGASGSAKPGGGDGGGGGVPALLKAPGGSGGSPGGSPAQNLAISVVPAKAPIAMVTAHLNGGLGGVEPPQSAPINLQTPARLAAARRPPELGSRTQVRAGGAGAGSRRGGGAAAAGCGREGPGGGEGPPGDGPAGGGHGVAYGAMGEPQGDGGSPEGQRVAPVGKGVLQPERLGRGGAKLVKSESDSEVERCGCPTQSKISCLLSALEAVVVYVVCAPAQGVSLVMGKEEHRD